MLRHCFTDSIGNQAELVGFKPIYLVYDIIKEYFFIFMYVSITVFCLFIVSLMSQVVVLVFFPNFLLLLLIDYGPPSRSGLQCCGVRVWVIKSYTP